MAGINLGSIYQQGGKTVVSGGSSGLDTQALLESLVEAKRLPAVRLEETIEANGTKMEALNELTNILQKFRDASDYLRNPPGVGNQASNIFAYRSASVTSNTGNGSGYLTSTVAAGTEPGSYNLTIDQLATRQTRVTNSFAAADTSASVVGGGGPFNAGTLAIGPDGVEVELEDGDTLAQVLAKINAVKTESGVEASAIKVTEGEYRITMKSIETGTDQNWDFAAANPGLLNVGFVSETDAVNALVTIDGTQVTRQSNTVDDLVEGITLQLSQVTAPGTELTLDVLPDTELARSAITNFVDAYNEFRVFAAKQTETTDSGARVEGAVLGTSGTLRSLINTIGTEISSLVQGLGDTNSLSALGISLTDYPGDSETPFTRNILQIDEAKLDAALESDYDAVRQVFEFNYVADDPNFVVYSKDNGLAGTDVVFNIDQTNGVYEAVVNGQTVTLAAKPLTSGGVSLTAPANSPLGEMNVLYVGSGDATVNVTMTQGIADRMFNAIENALDEDEGIVAQEIASLDTRNTRLQEDVTRIDEMIESYRVTLMEKFSALEAAIASVNNILQLLEAQADARASS